jgi:hypothetical protein
MTSEAVLREIPGGEALVDWFGRAPDFHDANLLEINLSNQGTGALRIHTWNMTKQTDEKGYFILDKHVVVTITLEEVTEVAINDFNLPGIIGSLEIMKSADGYRFEWDASYGAAGSICCRGASFDLQPGKP